MYGMKAGEDKRIDVTEKQYKVAAFLLSMFVQSDY